MGNKLRLCLVGDVQVDEPHAVHPKGFPSLSVFRVDDEFFVTNNHCTHGKAFLSDGFQEGDIIECPFHGGAFNIKSGAAIKLPCQEALKTYKVSVEDGEIFIDGDQKCAG